MLAVVPADGAVSVLEVAEPEPGEGQVLVAVHAAGINGADLLQARGLYPPPPGEPAHCGLELAGEVVALGPGAARFSLGDRVMAVVGGGGQAERAVVHERLLLPVPEELPWGEAGGFPEVFTTAHDALFTQCRLQMGEHLLVHGGAGGVGTAAVQLGVAAGARVTATVRNEQHREGVGALGATAIAPDGFQEHGPFDVVLELVGGGNLPGDVKALATGGRISIIGVGGSGGRAELDLLALMQKRGRIHGSTLRARPLEQKADAARRVERHVLPLLASGRIRVPVSGTFPLEEAAAAYARFAAGSKLGKIVLVTDH